MSCAIENPQVGGSKEKELQDEVEQLILATGGARIACPKGMRDIHPEQMKSRERAIEVIRTVFKNHGAVPLDTPTMELRSILLGQYGEESNKLIYHLQDETATGERLSLRYDLTVPLVRYVLQHRIDKIKRYQIAKVYRRDHPKAGRYREFTQCDFDVIGNEALPRLIDAECLQMIQDILRRLSIGNFVIKVNHRRMLNALLQIALVPPELFHKTCSIIDSLDKISWTQAREQLLRAGLLPGSVATLAPFLEMRGSPLVVINQLKGVPILMENAEAKIALEELEDVFRYAEQMNITSSLSFDLSLARGLDYYTGMIMEAFLLGDKEQEGKTITDKKEEGDEEPLVHIGAIGAGGRYDHLVADVKTRFSSSSSSSSSTQEQAATTIGKDAVGFSIGIERIFAILEQREKKKEKKEKKKKIGHIGKIRSLDTLVWIASAGKEKELETPAGRDVAQKALDMRISIASECWKANLPAEFSYQLLSAPKHQMQYANEHQIPIVLFVGPSELKQGMVVLRDMRTKKNITIARKNVVPMIQSILFGAGSHKEKHTKSRSPSPPHPFIKK